MSDLVIIQNRQAVTSSLQVAETFEKQHKHVLDAIETIKKGVAEKSADLFYKDTYIHEQNKQEYPMYYMNRDGFTLLAMGFTGKKALEFKLKYIEVFNQMEQTLLEQTEQTPYKLPSTFKEALYMLAEQVDINEQLEQQIENDREKVTLANAITTSDEGLLIEASAKYLRQNGINIGRDRLFKWLRSQGYLVNRKGREWNIPTQKSLNQGLMKIHTQQYFGYDGELKVSRQVVITGKGLMFFINKFLHDGQMKLPLK